MKYLFIYPNKEQRETICVRLRKSDYKIIDEFQKLSKQIGISQAKMDYLLWNYCSKGYGEICTATPKCEKCVIKKYCKRNK